jgi:hypothetical protein
VTSSLLRRIHVDANAVTQDSGVLARETNSKSSYSSSWSFGMKVRPETIGSETNTPPPYSFTCHAASGSFGSQATSSTSAGFPWKSTWSPATCRPPSLCLRSETSAWPSEKYCNPLWAIAALATESVLKCSVWPRCKPTSKREVGYWVAYSVALWETHGVDLGRETRVAWLSKFHCGHLSPMTHNLPWPHANRSLRTAAFTPNASHPTSQHGSQQDVLVELVEAL